MPMRRLNPPILMGDPGIVTTGVHPVMLTKRLIPLGDVFPLIGGEVLEGR